MTILAIIIALLIFAVIAMLFAALVTHFVHQDDEEYKDVHQRILNNYDQDENQHFI